MFTIVLLLLLILILEICENKRRTNESRSSKPECVNCKCTQPLAANSEASQPLPAICESTQPVVANCESTQPVSAICEFTLPEFTNCEATRPAPAICESTLLVVANCNSTQPVAVNCESTQSMAVNCDSTQPVVVNCESSQPVAAICESTLPVVANCNSTQPVTVIFVSKPVAVNCESTRPVSTRNESNHSTSTYYETYPSESSEAGSSFCESNDLSDLDTDCAIQKNKCDSVRAVYSRNELVRLNGESKDEWNDEYFINNFVQKYGVNARPDLGLSVQCAKMFVNWYINGICACDMSLVIVGMFGQATQPSSDEFLFDSSLFRVKQGKGIPRPAGVERMKRLQYSFEGANFAEVKDWYYSMFNLLDGKESRKRACINYLSYLAMTMMRCVKSPGSFYQRTSRISEDVVHLWDYSDVYVKRTPQPKETILRDSRFQRYGHYSTRCLTFIITSLVKSDDVSVVKIFQTSCLLTLRLFGMDCYRWTVEVAKSLDIDVDEIPFIDGFEAMVKKMRDLYERYDGPGADETSWPWASILGKKWFKYTSLGSNPLFALTMATIVLNKDVSKVIGLLKYKKLFADARVRAERFRKDYEYSRRSRARLH